MSNSARTIWRDSSPIITHVHLQVKPFETYEAWHKLEHSTLEKMSLPSLGSLAIGRSLHSMTSELIAEVKFATKVILFFFFEMTSSQREMLMPIGPGNWVSSPKKGRLSRSHWNDNGSISYEMLKTIYFVSWLEAEDLKHDRFQSTDPDRVFTLFSLVRNFFLWNCQAKS